MAKAMPFQIHFHALRVSPNDMTDCYENGPPPSLIQEENREGVLAQSGGPKAHGIIARNNDSR
ncbi:MAG: hypothetical protein ACRD18_08300 [Terriglobia bacterium]